MSLAEVEGLLEAELLVEGDGGGEVVDADGDVGDAVEGRWGSAVGLGVCEDREETGEDSDEQCACIDLADGRGRMCIHSRFL